MKGIKDKGGQTKTFRDGKRIFIFYLFFFILLKNRYLVVVQKCSIPPPLQSAYLTLGEHTKLRAKKVSCCSQHVLHHVRTKRDVSCASLVKQLKGHYEEGIRGAQNRFKGQKLLERDQSVWMRKNRCNLNEKSRFFSVKLQILQPCQLE